MEPGDGWPVNRRLSIFVSEAPLNNDLRVLVRVSAFRSAPLTTLGAKTGSEILSDPFNGTDERIVFGRPDQRPDGSFVLHSGGKKNFDSKHMPAAVALIFRVQEQEY